MSTRITNKASVPVWVVESGTTDAPHWPTAHLLEAGKVTPIGVAAQGVRSVDGRPIFFEKKAMFIGAPKLGPSAEGTNWLKIPAADLTIEGAGTPQSPLTISSTFSLFTGSLQADVVPEWGFNPASPDQKPVYLSDETGWGVPPPVTRFPSPTAGVNKFAQEHRVAIDGKVGVRFDATLGLINAGGLQCLFLVWLHDSSDKPLITQDPAYRSPDGAMCCVVPFTPTGSGFSQSLALSAFIPYEVISTAPGVTGVLTAAGVYWPDGQKYITTVFHPDWFTLANGPVDQTQADQLATRLKNTVVQKIQQNMQMLEALAGFDQLVWETLLNIAVNVNPNDRLITLTK
jgi:hypothetical protein